jgi:hypothetical protein
MPTAIIRPKSQNSNIRHDGILSIGNFMLMIKNHFKRFQLPGKLLITKKMCSLFSWQHAISYLFHLQYEISVRQSTIMLFVRNLGLLPDDDYYGPMLHWPPKALKLGFLSLFTIDIKFLIDRVPSCLTLEIWDFGRIGE